MGRALIVADALDPNVRGFFDAPAKKILAVYDDAERYRSIAAIPIQLASADSNDRPFGVVVATSDQPNRFVPSETGEDHDAVKPIRQLGNTLATLIAVNHLCGKESKNGS